MQEEYNKRLREFYDYIYTKYISNAKRWKLGYSLIKTINNKQIGIVGIDTAWRSSGKGSVEKGKMLVGEQQVNCLFNNVANADLTICLMHHPVDWISDLEMKAVERKLNKFDIVLRGHVHDTDDIQLCNQRNKTIYSTSGKIYPVENCYCGYSVLDIDLDYRTCIIYSREYYQGSRDIFDKALRINENGKVSYNLSEYDDVKAIEYDLRQQLKDYFGNAAEKYTMLKSIDNYSPDSVSDFFVEPVIYDKSEYERKKSNIIGQKTENLISIDTILNIPDNILIIGKKECGKTTTLQKIGLAYSCNENDKIPVYIDMLRLSKDKNRVLKACQTFIFDNMSPDMPVTKKQIVELLNQGRTVCLFDNINMSKPEHIIWIQKFTIDYPRNRYIFAIEEKFYQTYTLKELPNLNVKYKPIYLDYFGKYQVREMVTKWGKGKEGFNPNEMTNRIFSFCRKTNFAMTPFNIAVFMTIWDIDRNFVPINEGKVMRTYLETVLDKFSFEEFQRSEYDFDVKQNFLGYLSYKMLQKDEYYFTIDEFNNLVDEYHNQKGFSKAKTKFNDIFFEKNILCESGDYVFFANTSIMEYCLASYSLVDSDLYELISKKGNRVNFGRELSFYSGIVQDCTDLLDNFEQEIVSTILDNIDLIDHIEGLSIGIDFKLEKEDFTKKIVNNRQSFRAIDDISNESSVYENKSPMRLKKIETVDEQESFLELILIYGNIIKNAETADKNLKIIHLENYITGMTIQFGLILKEFSIYLDSKTKEDLPSYILEIKPDLTDEEFAINKRNEMELLKTVLPIALQAIIADNIGTPKLEMIINELISNNYNKKFMRFMLSFLLCDIGSVNIKSFLKKYINEEDSKDILKLILLKLSFYYSCWYFGNDRTIDEVLLDLITDVNIKLSSKDKAFFNRNKSAVKAQLKKQFSSKRDKNIINLYS